MSYYIIKNYAKSGKIGISHKVFCQVAITTAKDFNNVELLNVRSRVGSISYCTCIIEKSHVKLSLKVKLDDSADKTTLPNLTDAIVYNISSVCEIQSSNIHVTINS